MATTSMPATGAWRDLDRLAFCENAILLHLTSKSRGVMTTASRSAGELVQSQTLYDQLCEVFLDDVALVVAGDGGKDNVAAACLETNPAQPGRLFIRIARNDGVSERACQHLRALLDIAASETVSARSHSAEDAFDWALLRNIVQSCAGRINRHVEAFQGELKNAHCAESNSCKLPFFGECFAIIEPRDDMSTLGAYGAATHHDYAQLLHQRVLNLREACKNARRTQPDNTSNLCRTVEIAYSLRHATLLPGWLYRNLRLQTKASVMTKMVGDIVRRIGKLSRFYAAALTIANFVQLLARTATQIEVVGLPSHRTRVPELQYRTVADLRARGGSLLRRIPDKMLRSKLRLWDKYRVHAEIQLLIYYEENEDLTQVVPYIGSDKLCCYLCYAFISIHATFKVHGCHQSLYSLWMVPDDEVQPLSKQVGNRFHDILSRLCQSLQNQVQEALRQTGTRALYHPGAESCDHLSRVSLHMDSKQQRIFLSRRLRLNLNSQSSMAQDNDHLEGLGALPEPTTDVHHCQQDSYQYERAHKGSSHSEDISTSDLHDLQSVTQDSVPGNNSSLRVLGNYKQARFSDDLSIKGHESRACDVSITHDARDRQLQPCASFIIDTSRKFDFHEMELFFENESPDTVAIHASPHEAPQTSDLHVVDILALQYGEEYMAELGDEDGQQMNLFIKKVHKNGPTQWLKLSWQCG